MQPFGAFISPIGNQIVRLLPVLNLARQHVEEWLVVIVGVDSPALGLNGYLRDVLNRLPSMTNRQIQTLTPEVWRKARLVTAASPSGFGSPREFGWTFRATALTTKADIAPMKIGWPPHGLRSSPTPNPHNAMSKGKGEDTRGRL